MTTLTPDECFALYPEGSEAVIAFIRHRLANPAEGGHQHHLLIINRTRGGQMELWSRILGREITPDIIPLVSVTGPEHYQIHAELARCYQAQGSNGRFIAHSMSSSLLSQFAEMDDEGWRNHREMIKSAAQAKAKDPEWRATNKAAVQKSWAEDPNRRANQKAAMQALHADPNYKATLKVAAQKSWTENAQRRANHKAAINALFADPEYRAKQKEMLQSRAQDPEWKANHKAAQQKSWAENAERRENHRTAVQALHADPAYHAKHAARVKALTQTPEWREKNKAAAERRAQDQEWLAANKAQWQAMRANPEHLEKLKAGTQARHPDVIVTYPDGREERFGSQGDTARALGVYQAQIGEYLRGETKRFTGKLKGYSFRYAA